MQLVALRWLSSGRDAVGKRAHGSEDLRHATVGGAGIEVRDLVVWHTAEQRKHLLADHKVAGALQLVQPVKQDVDSGEHAGCTARRQLDLGDEAPSSRRALGASKNTSVPSSSQWRPSAVRLKPSCARRSASCSGTSITTSMS
ncbi:MAG: hypothetical protein ACJ76L_06745 [Conexibacter sp.]